MHPSKNIVPRLTWIGLLLEIHQSSYCEEEFRWHHHAAANSKSYYRSYQSLQERIYEPETLAWLRFPLQTLSAAIHKQPEHTLLPDDYSY